MAIYGSDEAGNVAQRFAAMAEPVVQLASVVNSANVAEEAARDECVGAGETGIPGVGPRCVLLRQKAYDLATLARARQEEIGMLGGSENEVTRLADQFRTMMCREVNAIARSNC